MKAIVDVDGTLWDLHALLLPELAKYGVPQEYPTDWYWYRDYCTDEEFYVAVDKVHGNQLLYPPFRGAATLFATLRRKNYEIIIASHRSPHRAYALGEWLAIHLPHVWSGIYAGNNKRFMIEPGDLVIDDSPKTINYALKSGAVSLALAWPWNTDTLGMKFQSLKEMERWLRGR